MIKFDCWKALNEDAENPLPAPIQVAPHAVAKQPPSSTPLVKPKTWKAGKSEIMRFWK